MDFVCDVRELEQVVGSRVLAAMLKSINVLDEHCETLLERSPLAVLGYTDRTGQRRAAAIGGAAGFATIDSASRLRIPTPADAAGGQPASLLFVIPGWRETLRVNGHLAGDDSNVLEVGECFVHCGKAIIRSGLWAEPKATGAATDVDLDVVERSGAAVLDDVRVREFLAAAPFMVITTSDPSGAADASPKGDPPGFMELLDDTAIAIPDRRGNRRTDTFHNLVEQPEVALIAMVPGDARILELRGTARLTGDMTLREAMTMQGRVPHAALVLDVTHCRLAPSDAVADAHLWDPLRHVDRGELPGAARIWTDHVKRNRGGGLAGAAIRAAVNERLVSAGTAVDYKQNLY